MTMLEKIENLLKNNIGNSSRLEHIKKCIVENKKIYNSDIQYVEELETRIKKPTESSDKHHSDDFDITCWKCEKRLVKYSQFCSFCGVRQDRKDSKFIQELSKKVRQEYNPLKIFSNFQSYQLLVIIGGIAGIIPILIATSNLDRILEIIEFYTGRDLSGFIDMFRAFGIISTGLCLFAIVVSFVIKKTKKVGRILFFLSFMILISSLVIGIAGFTIILFAAITALKKRRY